MINKCLIFFCLIFPVNFVQRYREIMAKNLELKIDIHNQRDELIEKCIKIGAAFEKELTQKDIYYKIEDGLLKLRIQNTGSELIQYKRDEVNPKRWSNYFVLNITDENAESFFSKLFSIEAIVEKKRFLYKYKNTRIHFDTVKNLGDFLELESVVTDSEENAMEEFFEIINLLNINLNQQIKKSYRDLIKNDSDKL